MVFLSILNLLFGLFMFIFPRAFWVITELWKSTGAEDPSKIFIISTKFGGMMFSIVGLLGVIFIPLLS